MGDEKQKHLHGDRIGRDKGTPNIPKKTWMKAEVDYVCDPDEPSIREVAERYDINPSTAQTHAASHGWSKKREQRKQKMEDIFADVTDQIEQRFKEVADKNFKILSEMVLRSLKRWMDKFLATDKVPSISAIQTMQKMMRLSRDKSTEIHGVDANEGWEDVERKIGEVLNEDLSDGEDEDVKDNVVSIEVVKDDEEITPGKLE